MKTKKNTTNDVADFITKIKKLWDINFQINSCVCKKISTIVPLFSQEKPLYFDFGWGLFTTYIDSLCVL